MSNLDNYETAQQAAKRLNLTDGRIRQMCRWGEIEAIKVGRDWLIPKGATPKPRKQH